MRKLRQALPAAFPEDIFYFQAADMVTQILNFGVTAQIDVRTVGYDRVKNLHIARQLRRRIGAIPGVADTHLQQEVDAPAFFAAIDRTRAAELGLNASQIATNLNVSLSSSEQVTPNFWTDPAKGIPYYLAVQTPEPQVASLNALTNTPVSTALSPQGDPVPGLLSNVATLTRIAMPTNANQANIQPIYEVYANRPRPRPRQCRGRDRQRSSPGLQKELSPGNSIQVLGQIQSMNDAFRDMGIGLLFAAVFVYLLMVVNYQNFGDPLVVILALPATFCGIVTMLYITDTTLSVPSLMGAIMAVGVASANSILLVTFAREQQLAGMSAFDAAISAGRTRIRPVLMTAAAMIVGMIPMAIGGPGEEQNAALARAVIGGLAVRDADYPARRALPLRHAAQTQRRQTRAGRLCGGTINDRPRPSRDRVSGRGAGILSAAVRRARSPQWFRSTTARPRRAVAAPRRSGDRRLAALRAAPRSHGRRRAAPRLHPERPCRSGAGEPRHDERHLAGHHQCLPSRQHLCPRQRLYHGTQCRYRLPCEGGRPAGGDHRPGARPPDRPGRGQPGSGQGVAPANQGEP